MAGGGEIPNPNDQIPKKSQIPKTNRLPPEAPLWGAMGGNRVGILELGFFWDLGFEIWDLARPLPGPA